jgi:hypothetical protein
MKLAYLLQTLKGLPLGYDFRLHTYGPFDSDVLNDLAYCESLGAVKSELVRFESGSGYGYEFAPGKNQQFVSQRAGQAASEYSAAVQWALQEFGQRTAAELEVVTTIIYADREAAQRTKQLSVEDLAREVRAVKPRYTQQYITAKIEELKSMGLLVALGPSEPAR